MADKFPPELIRHIVAHLCTHQDAHTLRAASMAGSALRGPCQERLFSSLSIVGAPKPGTVETPCLRLLRRFRQSNVLTSYVKAVDIHGHDDEWFADGFLRKAAGTPCRIWISQEIPLHRGGLQVDLEGVPQENLALGNPGLKEIRLHAALDNPNHSIFETIHSEGIASPEVLSISQSQPLIGALLAPGSGMSWECLRELTIKRLRQRWNTPARNRTIQSAKHPYRYIRADQTPSSGHSQLPIAVYTISSIASCPGTSTPSPSRLALPLQAGPDGQAFQGNSWDIDFEVDYDEGWASIAATIADKDRFPALKAFVVQGPGVDEGIRKHLTHLDQTGLWS
ncbi:hypothetical protein BKA70DRAFT_1561833 [Coprinopsis sp. MPI-PUGE-AT-0042]|nr:hypothetical protein BKA70DRAFT_1561833 [Coprinopsis sp. MPI-PUGE-AT-0042]